ncbi:MAG: hypothetical protein ACKVQJ_02475 [Pyrinomonadaceae bacterium]
MSNPKNQNSIIFIATLGVYLGLVLAGATPQVLANAAMTRQFDVKDEIEVKDDLDNKPDDERSPVSESVKIYLEDVEYFLSSLGRLKNRGKFDITKDTFSVAKTAMLPCVSSNLAGRYTPVKFESTNDNSRVALDQFSRGMEYGYSLGDCLANNEFNGPEATDSRFYFELDVKTFTVNVTVKKQTPQRALDLIRELDSVLALYAAKDNDKLRKQIIANTAFRAENRQVVVSTQLPRGSLDSLLAPDAK